MNQKIGTTTSDARVSLRIEEEQRDEVEERREKGGGGGSDRADHEALHAGGVRGDSRHGITESPVVVDLLGKRQDVPEDPGPQSHQERVGEPRRQVGIQSGEQPGQDREPEIGRRDPQQWPEVRRYQDIVNDVLEQADLDDRDTGQRGRQDRADEDPPAERSSVRPEPRPDLTKRQDGALRTVACASCGDSRSRRVRSRNRVLTTPQSGRVVPLPAMRYPPPARHRRSPRRVGLSWGRGDALGGAAGTAPPGSFSDCVARLISTHRRKCQRDF